MLVPRVYFDLNAVLIYISDLSVYLIISLVELFDGAQVPGAGAFRHALVALRLGNNLREHLILALMLPV